MTVLTQAKQQIIAELKAALEKGAVLHLEDLERPPEAAMGDFSFPCFTLAKGLQKNPVEIAKDLAGKITPKDFIKEVKAAGPYLNFVLDDKTLGDALFASINEQGAKFGASDIGAGRRLLLEYAQPNTHKEI